MTETIQTIYVPIALHEVRFAVTPHAEAYTTGSETWQSWPAINRPGDLLEVVPAVYKYASNTLLTFTSDIHFPTATASATEIRWRFGDGTESTGAGVTHTYTQVREMIVHCGVRDNLGRWAYCSKVLYLKP